MLLLFILFWLVADGWIIYKTAKTIIRMINGKRLLNKALKNGEEVIRCNYAVFDRKNYIIPSLFKLYFIYITLSYINKSPETFILILPTALCMAVQLIILFLAYSREKYAYLTNDGVIFTLGCFKFTECRFTWEGSAVPDRLNIYRPKAKVPYSVTFDQQVERAHEIIDNHVPTF